MEIPKPKHLMWFYLYMLGFYFFSPNLTFSAIFKMKCWTLMDHTTLMESVRVSCKDLSYNFFLSVYIVSGLVISGIGISNLNQTV